MVIVITAVGVGELLSHGSLGVVLIQVPCSKYNPDIREFFHLGFALFASLYNRA